jgi:hypothetical protein
MKRKTKVLKPQAVAFFAAAGRRGARKLHQMFTPEQRKERARRAVTARWAQDQAKLFEDIKEPAVARFIATVTEAYMRLAQELGELPHKAKLSWNRALREIVRR